MATNLSIDPQLLQRALEIGGEPTKRATVTVALQEYVARRERAKIVDSFGAFDWDPEYDYRADRRKRDAADVG